MIWTIYNLNYYTFYTIYLSYLFRMTLESTAFLDRFLLVVVYLNK